MQSTRRWWLGPAAVFAGVLAWGAPASGDLSPPPLILGATAEITPSRLPRTDLAPVALSLGFTSRSPGASAVPEIDRVSFELSRDVAFDTTGLPSCPLAELYAEYESARQECARSVLGEGRVASEITLPGQAPASVEGHLVAFFNDAADQPRVLAQVITGEPLPVTYVIPFTLAGARGAYATSLSVRKMRNIRGRCRRDHPRCFTQPYTLKGVYGHISELEMSLHRLFGRDGRRRSFVGARCPAASGVPGATLSLARVSLRTGGTLLTTSVVRSCQVSR